MLSHDFRGPLSIAKSYAFGLMARLAGADLEACRELESELDSLARMTDNLMLSLEGSSPVPVGASSFRGDHHCLFWDGLLGN